jgi:hypothetical protein
MNLRKCFSWIGLSAVTSTEKTVLFIILSHEEWKVDGVVESWHRSLVHGQSAMRKREGARNMDSIRDRNSPVCDQSVQWAFVVECVHLDTAGSFPARALTQGVGNAKRLSCDRSASIQNLLVVERVHLDTAESFERKLDDSPRSADPNWRWTIFLGIQLIQAPDGTRIPLEIAENSWAGSKHRECDLSRCRRGIITQSRLAEIKLGQLGVWWEDGRITSTRDWDVHHNALLKVYASFSFKLRHCQWIVWRMYGQNFYSIKDVHSITKSHQNEFRWFSQINPSDSHFVIEISDSSETDLMTNECSRIPEMINWYLIVAEYVKRAARYAERVGIQLKNNT